MSAQRTTCAVCGVPVVLLQVGPQRLVPASRYWLGDPEDWIEAYCGPACSLARAGQRGGKRPQDWSAGR